MKIEILCTGDEILSGKTINTNHSYIARRLVENGFTVYWGTIVGDDRESLQTAFQLASQRADIVIVNGGLGPTVDDLSQEVAAASAGVGLILHKDWLERMRAWYTSRGRVMPDNNEKQAMLPEGAEFIDNPIGTACGFAVTIADARFYFTPGVPREMRRMIDEQILPRLQKIRGHVVVTKVKRFHTFGIGESRADLLLEGVEEMVEGGAMKLGFQSHYPQLETKLTIQGESEASIEAQLAPAEAAVRERFAPFIICEDNQTLEGKIVNALIDSDRTLSIMEMHTGGSVTARLLKSADHGSRIPHSQISQEATALYRSINEKIRASEICSVESAEHLAQALRNRSQTNCSLVVMMSLAEPQQEQEGAADVYIAIADGQSLVHRYARLPGSGEWSRLGAAELAMDCLRRYLEGLPVYQKIDFEQH
ncbi:MAG: CinA family nicotinamide mononucleotide deamidase-related protein [Granulosicoccus sp.]|nr:CinA family nicotinamide mononucleotide deamidase-related protein [Granulosicoccus sp.]